MVIDPVCKMQIDENEAAGKSEYNGKTYYFCARSCKAKFEQNPQAHAYMKHTDHHSGMVSVTARGPSAQPDAQPLCQQRSMTITEKLKTKPPPLICLAALLMSLAFNAIWPLVSIPGYVRYIAGSLLIMGSLLAMPSILIKFRRMDTSFDVRKSPSAFISDGPYRFSRNPSYVALVLLFIGLGVALNNLWVLIWLVPAAVIIDRYVIPEEERRLELAFGDQYRAYKSQVRRWL